MSEDRSKPPQGFDVTSDDGRAWDNTRVCVDIDDYFRADEHGGPGMAGADGARMAAVAACWAFVDRIRAEERERLAKIAHAEPQMFSADDPSTGCDVARWLRAGGPERHWEQPW